MDRGRHVVTCMTQQYCRVIQSTKHYIAVSKPPFTICQDELQNPSSLSNLLRRISPELFDTERLQHPFHPPKGVHRLDALVTGCVLYGTSVYGTRQLSKNFRKRMVSKGYLALLCKLPHGSSILETCNDGEIASEDRSTQWHVLARLPTLKGVLFVCWLQPREGRNHQLRIHAAEELNAPVVFDRRYPHDPSKSREEATKHDVYAQASEEGIALHCATMTFPLGLESHFVSCTPPPIGIWQQVSQDFNIDWVEVVARGHEYRHPSLNGG